MMRKTFYLLLLLATFGTAAMAQTSPFVNLTPKAKKMTTSAGTLSLPLDFKVLVQNDADTLTAEAQRFVDDFNRASGGTASVVPASSADALVRVSLDETLAAEGYTLNVAADGITITAATTAGLFYAFQSVEKMLPGNVMAGVADPAVTSYDLPLVSIEDEPRFGYRGFMLDVARHFFTVEEVKRILDMMAIYKLNRFHWHLSDDQGWRVEIKKYPKLTTIGATAKNCYVTDMKYGPYWTNKVYGPYFYTKEELKDVVAYAKARHIEIIPEIDMPGHFVAAMTAYPEYSCWPNGSHEVWINGGISSDVLNVANPAAVQFAKDILTEIMDIFPYDYIHIGGDECPTSAWEGNAECQALYNSLGLSSYRELQSHFIKDMGDYIKENGRKLVVWNESITADGADTDLIKATDATVFCWMPAAEGAKKAAQLGLNNVFTPWGPYYINRKQSSDAGEPSAAGDGTDTVEKTYNTEAVPTDISAELAKYYTGVQGTFWTEHVATRDYLEYLAFPRFQAIAEAGWTPKSGKNFDNFIERMKADTAMWNYNGYEYGRHYLRENSRADKVMPVASTASEQHWYHIQTRATDATRTGRVWELLSATSPLVTQYAGNGAAENVLWTNARDEANPDCQLWAFEQSEADPTRWALVCKAQPEGSLNPNPTQKNNGGRWKYDVATKNYNFVLADNQYGQEGNYYYYSLRSDQVSGWYMNASMSGQGLAVNLWTNAADGNGGQWIFEPMEGTPAEPVQSFDYLEEGKTYSFVNAVEGFENISLADDGRSTNLVYTVKWGDNAWTVVGSTVNEDGTQTVQLQNTATARKIAAAASAATGQLGYPVSVGTAAAGVLISQNQPEEDFTLSVGGKNLFPVPATSVALSGIVSAGSSISGLNAVRPMGAAWTFAEVRPLTYVCQDENGAEIATFRRSWPVSVLEGENAQAEIEADLPVLKNMSPLRAVMADDVVTVTYQRSAYAVRVICRDQRGAIVSDEETAVPVGEPFNVAYPEIPYYEFEGADVADGTVLVPEADQTLEAVYTTEAFSGVKALGKAVSELKDGCSYVIYDTSPNATERIGYRNINPATGQIMKATSLAAADPYYTWTMEKVGSGFKVKNEYLQKYIPALTQSGAIIVGATGDVFTFTLNADGETWKVKGSNGQYWDGVAGSMTGWHTYGHPYMFFEYVARPYFRVTVRVEDTEGALLSESQHLVEAGDNVQLLVPEVKGYTLKSVENAAAAEGVSTNAVVKYIFEKNEPVGIEGITADELDNSRMYDVSGRRLVRIPAKGVYIIGGRKVVK